MMKNLSLILLFLLNFSLYSYTQENCESAKIKYLELNPDVKKNGMDAWDHFTIFGKKEGRIWPKCEIKYQQNNASNTIVEQNNGANFKNITFYPNLKLQDNKLFINDQLYNGFFYSYYDNRQVKSIQEIKEGIINGVIVEFWFDKSFDSKKYRDTALISNYNIDLQKTKLELSSNSIDTTKAGKDERAFLDNEIGGYDKLLKIREKNNEGKLNKTKKEEYDHYQGLVQLKNTALQKLNYTNKLISDLEKNIKTEQIKEIYIPIKSSEAEFNLGKLNGSRKLYYENGKLKSEENYKSGELDGIKKEYFENGNSQSSCTYLNGKKSGLFTFYNNLGKKMNECNFVDDQKNGKEFIYNTNGILISDYNFVNNDMDGLVKEFYDNGKIKNDYTISKNVKSGKFIKYYDNGQVMEEGAYLNGKQSGEWKYYYNSGIIKAKGSYLDGDGGNLTDLGIPQNGRNGKFFSFHENGKTKQETNWTNGKQNGKFITYMESGQIEAEVTILNEKKHGPFVRYYPSGKILMKATIDTNSIAENHLIGDIYEYNENGTVKIHAYIHKDGRIEDKLASNNNNNNSSTTSTNNSSEMNKPYNCKCCKAKINGLMNGVNKDGEEPDNFAFPMLLELYSDPSAVQLANWENFGQEPYKNGYDILRKTAYMFCSMKCARTCN